MKLKQCISAAVGVLMFASPVMGDMTDIQVKAESRKYSQPVAVMSRSTGTAAVSECMNDGNESDYTPNVPDADNLDADNVTSSTYYSPARLQNDWYIFDHVGFTDNAFSGRRHIVYRDSGGIQWFGYGEAPNNDFMLRDFSDDINGSSFTINIKQAPVRADWHTINGSGILFGTVMSSKPAADGAPESYDSAAYTGTFSSYAFVATNSYNEMRYYDNVKVQDSRMVKLLII